MRSTRVKHVVRTAYHRGALRLPVFFRARIEINQFLDEDDTYRLQSLFSLESYKQERI